MKTNNLKFNTQKEIIYDGQKATIYVKIRLNDECKNGHQDFSITGDIYKGAGKSDSSFLTGGCIHEEILKYFPEFKTFVNLHLCDFAGVPMYAIANGFYHMKNGYFSEYKKETPEEFKKHFCEYYRITPREFEELEKAKDQNYYGFLIQALEIPKRWAKEAKEAIKLLENLTGDEFINDSKKSQLDQISEDKIEEIKTKIKEGFYTEEAIEERENVKIKEAKEKQIEKIKNDAKSKIEEIQKERDIKLYLLSKDIPINNVIFYKHTNKLTFNWKEFEKGITENEFNAICEGFDLNRWNGLTLELAGVKQYGPTSHK